MQQRFYLPTDYAAMLDSKASGAGVSPIIYLQHLITQDHICSGIQPVAATAVQQAPAPAPVVADDGDGPQLTGRWEGMSL